ARRGLFQDLRRQFAASLMLLAKDGGEIGQLSLFLEAREEMLFLELLVVPLDEIADERRRGLDGKGGLAGVQPARALLVDEEHAVEEAMLPHQVFGGRDLGLLRRGLWNGNQ